MIALEAITAGFYVVKPDIFGASVKNSVA